MIVWYEHIWYFHSSSRLVPLLLSDEVWSQAGGERASGATGHFSGAAIFFWFYFFSLQLFELHRSKSKRTKIQNNNQMSFDSPSPSIRSIRSIRIQHRMSVLQVFIPFATFAHHHHTWLHWLQWLQIHFQKSDHPPLPILEPGRQIWWNCGKRILRGAE